MTAVVQDDVDFFQDGQQCPASPQDKPTSSGPDLDPESDPLPHGMRAQFHGALIDHTPGAGDGCHVWYVNSWALGWSRET